MYRVDLVGFAIEPIESSFIQADCIKQIGVIFVSAMEWDAFVALLNRASSIHWNPYPLGCDRPLPYTPYICEGGCEQLCENPECNTCPYVRKKRCIKPQLERKFSEMLPGNVVSNITLFVNWKDWCVEKALEDLL